MSPGDAKLPRTLRVICVFGATVEGVNPTSGGDGGGDGGSDGGGGDGGADGGARGTHTRHLCSIVVVIVGCCQ